MWVVYFHVISFYRCSQGIYFALDELTYEVNHDKFPSDKKFV